MVSNPDAIIVGAGPAGLACAGTMRAAGLDVTVFEKAGDVGAAWRRHYDRLHLHTDRNHSGLPGMAMSSDYPAYLSREQMIAYLESYAARFEIKPVFDTAVSRLCREGAQWRRRHRPGFYHRSHRCSCNRYRGRTLSSVVAGIGEFCRRRDPQQRIPKPRAIRGKARARDRLR